MVKLVSNILKKPGENSSSESPNFQWKRINAKYNERLHDELDIDLDNIKPKLIRSKRTYLNRGNNYHIRNPIYHRPCPNFLNTTPRTLKTMTNEMPSYDIPEMYFKVPLSKFIWDRRYISLLHIDKIVEQLKESNEFVLSYEEYIVTNLNDIYVYAGYYEEIPRELCRIKLTNSDRRMILNLSCRI